MKKICKWYYVCPINYFTQEGKLPEKWVNNYCKGNWGQCVRYDKEERGIYHPDNMLPDGSIDKSLN